MNNNTLGTAGPVCSPQFRFVPAPARAQQSRTLAFHIDILLLALLSVIALSNLPRAYASAYARFASSSDWAQGYFLRWVRPDARSKRQSRSEDSGKGHGLDQSRRGLHLSATPSRSTSNISIRTPTPTAYPPHVPAYPARLLGLARILQYRISPGLSLGRIVILAGYISILSYALFYHSGPIMDPDRSGYIAVSQIPLVFLLAMKSNVFGWVLGVASQKLHYIHRFAGRLVTIIAHLHAISYIYLYTIDGTLSERMQTPHMAWGLVALVCIDVLAIFSMSWSRHRAYSFFYNSHVVTFSILIPALCFHHPALTPFMLAAASAYALDHLLSLLKTRITRAKLTLLPELRLTRVSIPALNAGWRTGQHVRLRVLSSGMGWLGWAEAHPFTIASVSRDERGMVLLCKKTGDWTGRLYEMAKAAGYGDVEGMAREKEGGGRDVLVVVQGPYGGPGHTVFASYSGAVFAAGGSGISFALAAVQDLVQKDLLAASCIKVIELVWVVQDPASIIPFHAVFTSLIRQSKETPLRISVHYTRATRTHPPALAPFPGLTLAAGRPRLDKLLDSVLERVSSLGAGRKDEEPITGVLFGVCGPSGLRDDVVSAVGGVDVARRAKVGGIEVYEEVFGW